MSLATPIISLFGIWIFGWSQTMPNHSGAEKLRLLLSLGRSAYSGIRHSDAERASHIA
jgi:hypothetical protein